jgi:hypothetical protein
MDETKEKKERKTLSTQLAAKIWGHRFREGQRGPEYTLEFLNVLAGADYKLGAREYTRYKKIGFRKFIFEGSKEGRDNNIVRLGEKQKENLYRLVDTPERAEVIRNFLLNQEIQLRDRTGKEANRSWYARTLYPLHEALLFFEVRVENKEGKKEEVSIERNFFARGGELYYLMLTYGTKCNPEIRNEIQERLRELLQQKQSIGNLVTRIDEALKDENIDNKDTPGYLVGEDENRDYPTLPTKDCALFAMFAEQFARILRMKIDIDDLFHILTSLICFHLTLYMNQRASEQCNGSLCACSEACNPCKSLYFFDCLDSQVPQISKESSRTFTYNENRIKDKFEEAFKKHMLKTLGENDDTFIERLNVWKEDEKSFLETFKFTRTHEARRKTLKNAIQRCKSYDDVINILIPKARDIISDQLKKNQLTITRVLAHDGGLGGYRQGEKYRYFMSDKFLQSLVFSILNPGQYLEFDEFLEILYEKYGIVIGEKQAKASGIYERSKLNVKYFQMNEKALRVKLRNNGLLVEYSDATAMIHNPYESVQKEVTVS